MIIDNPGASVGGLAEIHTLTPEIEVNKARISSMVCTLRDKSFLKSNKKTPMGFTVTVLGKKYVEGKKIIAKVSPKKKVGAKREIAVKQQVSSQDNTMSSLAAVELLMKKSIALEKMKPELIQLVIAMGVTPEEYEKGYNNHGSNS